MKLYDAPASGNAYKIRLFLSLLGVEHQRVPVNLRAGESRTDEFLSRNPRGQVPVLEDGEIIVWDSQAILVYLARRYGGDDWLPLDPAPMAEVMQWMAVSENELLFGLARARAAKLFGRPWNLSECRQYGKAGLDVMEQHLANRQWLAAGAPTIADVACFPYVALAPEGGIPLNGYHNVLGWIGRVQKLPGYTGMKGIHEVRI